PVYLVGEHADQQTENGENQQNLDEGEGAAKRGTDTTGMAIEHGMKRGCRRKVEKTSASRRPRTGAGRDGDGPPRPPPQADGHPPARPAGPASSQAHCWARPRWA